LYNWYALCLLQCRILRARFQLNYNFFTTGSNLVPATVSFLLRANIICITAMGLLLHKSTNMHNIGSVSKYLKNLYIISPAYFFCSLGNKAPYRWVKITIDPHLLNVTSLMESCIHKWKPENKLVLAVWLITINYFNCKPALCFIELYKS